MIAFYCKSFSWLQCSQRVVAWHQHQHLPGTCQKCKLSGLTPDNWIGNSEEGTSNLYFNKSSRWCWSLVKFEMHCSNVCFKVKMINCFSLRFFLNSKNFKTKKEMLLQIHVFNKSITQPAVFLFLYSWIIFGPLLS